MDVRRRPRAIASLAGLSAISTALVAFVITDPGYHSPDVTLHDSGVWVTRTSQLQLGRFNYEAQTVDASVVGASADLDVLQHDDLVLLTDKSANSVTIVDPAAVVPSNTTIVPDSDLVALGGRTVAIWEPGGSVWVCDTAALTSFDPNATIPIAQVSDAGAVAVSIDGTVAIADPVEGELTTIRIADDGTATTTTARLAPGAASGTTPVQVTWVGDTPVVLETETGRLFFEGRERTVAGDGLVLQAPGPDSDAVLVAGANGLISQPLSGDTAEVIQANGVPTTPIRVGSCGYGAWSSGQVVRVCGTDIYTGSVPLAGAARYRTNRGYVVLNDLAAGTVWLADSDFTQIDQWQDIASSDPGEDESTPEDPTTPIDQVLADRQLPNRPPVAVDDTFGIRAGRTTVITVLDNDTDEDGDALRATPTSAPQFGTVEQVMDGRALQVTVPADAAGSTSAEYTADDGRENGTDTATVTLEVHPDSVNGAPTQLRPTQTAVLQGGTVEFNALTDWRDPDGDPLLLAEVTPDPADLAQFSPDGKVTFTDGGVAPGIRTVTIRVSDGTAVTEGHVTIEVLALADNRAPIPGIDHYSTVAGRAITATPLDNDTDPNGDPLRLARVDDVPGLTLTRNLDVGELTVTAETSGTYYLTYVVTDGPAMAVGLVRIDVLPTDNTDPPVAVPDRALLPTAGHVLVDVLANDSDPAGNVLVVQSAHVQPASGLTATVISHSMVKVVGTRPLDSATTVEYTVSNGASSATGQIVVLPAPASAGAVGPQARDDEATVRAGDIVTIDVLANDEHPAGLEFNVDAALSDTPSTGTMFVSGNTVRFRAGTNAETVSATYTVRDTSGQTDSARITIHVNPAGLNTAPVPQTVTARMVSGQIQRIVIPVDGIDPDGDSVTVIGVSRAPGLGRVTATGGNWIEYEATSDAVGTDSLAYQVIDQFGARAEGTVLIGIAPATAANQPPMAVPDHRVVRPSRQVTVPVLGNDIDPDGDRLSLTGTPTVGNGVSAYYDADQIVVRTGSQDGTVGIGYIVDDGVSTAQGMLTIEISASAPTLPPLAYDDYVPLADVLTRDTVEVHVVDNDEDPDGSVADLDVTSEAGIRVDSDGTLNIPVNAAAQRIAYTVTDPDGNQDTAFVHVPGVGDAPPTLRSGDQLTVTAGGELVIDLSEYVLVAPGRAVRVTQAERVIGLRGQGSVIDDHTIRFVADQDYHGAAAITVEVIDSEIGDPDGRKSTLTIPIDVLPAADVPPTVQDIQVAAPRGEQTRIDLTHYATDANGDRLTFTVHDVPDGLTARIDGSVLVVEPDANLSPGTVQRFGWTVGDGTTQINAAAEVTVTGSDLPQAVAVDDEIADAELGRTYTVRVLDNDLAPHGTHLTIADAEVESGTAAVAHDATTISVTPSSGNVVVLYTVDDGTGDPLRQVVGRLRVTVQGVPGTPGAPIPIEVRSGAVDLHWSPPATNGSPITHYVVRVDGPGGSEQTCPTNTCTITGLSNASPYRFAVSAVNGVGASEWSAASPEVVPDAVPDTPAAPTMTAGNGQVTITWVLPGGADSVVVELSPAPLTGSAQRSATGTTLVWTGLDNGTAYRARVQAVNEAGVSAWSPYSASTITAGVPDAPGRPTTTGLYPVGDQAQMLVSWSPPATVNGDPITGYTLEVLHGGTNTATIPAGTATSYTMTLPPDETGYTYRVIASNNAGDSAPSPESIERRAVVPPEDPMPAQASATGASGEIRVTVTPLTAEQRHGARASEIVYEYSTDGEFWYHLPGTTGTITGLTNGHPYTVLVRSKATVDEEWFFSPEQAATYTGVNSTGSGVTPYGPLQPVHAEMWIDGTTVVPKASVADNGCSTVLYYRYWNTAGSPPSYTITHSRIIEPTIISTAGQTWRVQAYASDDCGQSSIAAPADESGITVADDGAQVDVVHGTATTTPECQGASCAHIALQYTGITGTHTVRFHSTYPPEGIFATTTATFTGDGQVETDAVFGHPGYPVWAEVVGVATSPHLTW